MYDLFIDGYAQAAGEVIVAFECRSAAMIPAVLFRHPVKLHCAESWANIPSEQVQHPGNNEVSLTDQCNFFSRF